VPTETVTAFIVHIFTKAQNDVTSEDWHKKISDISKQVLANRWSGCGMNEITEDKPQICLSRIIFLFLHQTVCTWVFNKLGEVRFNEMF
jgi:hypothetical protein